MSDTPEFPNQPEDNQDTKNAVILISEIINNDNSEKRIQDAQELIKTSIQPDDRSLYLGEIMPGEKFYAFCTAAEGQDRGYKGTGSYYYLTETKLRTMADHGLIDFRNLSYDPKAISEILGVPPENKVNCIVEITAPQRVAYFETSTGPANWPRETEFEIVPGEGYNQLEVFNRSGGGYQAFPELTRLNKARSDEITLPISSIDGVKCDFREFREVHNDLSLEKIEKFRADYEHRRVTGQIKADEIMIEKEDRCPDRD